MAFTEKKKDMFPIAVSAIAAKKALENVIEDVYKLAKGNIRDRVKNWRTKSKISNLYKGIASVRKVKTILNVEKEVDILKFYYPSKIESRCRQKPIPITDLDDLPYKGNLVIQGIVGLGKSILFRYLTWQELVKGNVIPVFAELRNIKNNQTLIDYLLEEMELLGLELDRRTFAFIAKQGKVVLFLDGFDEIAEMNRRRILSEIERLANRYEEIRILISSRPNSDIVFSPSFRVFNLSPLQGIEYEKVLTRMVGNPKIASKIIEQIRRSESKIPSLLISPPYGGIVTRALQN
jgi:predicted NACHT family NTPase